MQTLRIASGALLLISGIVLTLLPGSILLVLGGLMLLSVDWPPARRYLVRCQRSMARGARRIDRYLLLRKMR